MLNAFRHHCCRHDRVEHTLSTRLVCSTPFGITAVVTRGVRVEGGHESPCSTPFGITAVVTAGRPRWPARRTVLNAFRHHCCRHGSAQGRGGRSDRRCSTPFGITAVVTRVAVSRRYLMRGAQRLSASLLSSPKTRLLRREHGRGAQRLSASLLSSRRRRGRLRQPDRVLNAFRHHCCRHEVHSVNMTTLCSVLNAFRHHCCRHTYVNHVMYISCIVLNAFRHHCCRHSRWARTDDRIIRCSTPFGITAVVTSQ